MLKLFHENNNPSFGFEHWKQAWYYDLVVPFLKFMFFKYNGAIAFRTGATVRAQNCKARLVKEL